MCLRYEFSSLRLQFHVFVWKVGDDLGMLREMSYSGDDDGKCYVNATLNWTN